MSRRDWIRVRVRWWSDPDHISLSGDSLQIGPMLMMLADSDPTWRETGSARLLGPSGCGLSPTELAKLARWTPTRTKRALKGLVEVRTLLVGTDGTFYFPNYRKHQEDPSTRRKRSQRECHGDSHAPVTVNVTPDVTVEVEEEGEADRRRRSKPPARPQKRPMAPPSPESVEIAQYLYDAIRSHNSDFQAKAQPRATATKLGGWAKVIDDAIRIDGMTVEGAKIAIDAAHRSPDKGGDFSWRSNLMSGRALKKHYERLLSDGRRALKHDPARRDDDEDFGAAKRDYDRLCGRVTT